MTSILPLLCLIHFVAVGLALGRLRIRVSPGRLLWIFAYFAAVHLALAMILIANPGLVDPRH